MSLLNAMDPGRFPRLLSRLLQKLHLKVGGAGGGGAGGGGAGGALWEPAGSPLSPRSAGSGGRRGGSDGGVPPALRRRSLGAKPRERVRDGR